MMAPIFQLSKGFEKSFKLKLPEEGIGGLGVIFAAEESQGWQFIISLSEAFLTMDSFFDNCDVSKKRKEILDQVRRLNTRWQATFNLLCPVYPTVAPPERQTLQPSSS
jgi:hypothetical protein